MNTLQTSLLILRYCQGMRNPSSTGLRDYLESHGKHITLRTAQRYLSDAELVLPLKEWRKRGEPTT